MDQTVINWILAGAGTAAGFILKVIWDAVKDLQKADKEMAEKVSAIEVLVAGNYVTRDEFLDVTKDIKSMLAKIFDKLDGKADK